MALVPPSVPLFLPMMQVHCFGEGNCVPRVTVGWGG